ncbi:MAG: acyl-CoA/acyl-ACP dehydrogenase [Gammaproteobacteria bacterium]|nr:acyl-CoA/acyl-ACP dehydrogenase [Gammaproteobacteria bacterium]
MNNPDYHLKWLGTVLDKSLKYINAQCTKDGKFSVSRLDDFQQAVFDLAVCTAELQCALAYLDYSSAHGEFEKNLAETFAAEVIRNITSRLGRNPEDFCLSSTELVSAKDCEQFCKDHLSNTHLTKLGQQIVDKDGDLGDRGLDQEKLMMAETFRQFADEVIKPLAENIHRKDLIIPDEILNGLRELGCFGLSVPQEYGGLLPDDHEDSLGMIVVTEELSRASLGGAGSLITRPEIMARALLEGGTGEQKAHWLPKLASGDLLCAIAITEPDYGSDVASIRLKATATDDGWVLNGAKAWSTFAGKSGVLLTLARTDPDLSLGHRGLSLFMVEKPSTDDDKFEFVQKTGGKLSGKAIPTIGYRGMHSFELFFDDFFIPASHMIGEGQGVGRGFYFTMRGFMGGRIQTAARACGVMQAAFETSINYATGRKVFGKPIADYQLSLIKFARMGIYLGASRQFTYSVGKLMDAGQGQIEASLVKLFACKASEWITREGMQIHGGMGYAEETSASRYWLDARVLSIFEGTEETLALKVVGRSLVESAL